MSLNFIEKFSKKFLRNIEAFTGKITTTELVQKLYDFCELSSGKKLYPYQEQFAKRIIRSLLENDGEEITSLFARQSGKSETIGVVVSGLMIILPTLANMPMFIDDIRLTMFKDGLWVGIFAPSQRQAQITYNRIKNRIQSPSAQIILNDPEFNISFTTSNGQTVALSNHSFATAISASDGSNIEGESFKMLILEECQDISNYKIRKCLTGDTRVLLEDGTYKRLDEIVRDKKDSVVCYDLTMTYVTTKKPSEYYDNGVQDVFKITLENGDFIKATLHHQFYTFDAETKDNEKYKFKSLMEIRDKFYYYNNSIKIGVPERLYYFKDSQDNDYEKGLIVGYLIACESTEKFPKFIGDLSSCKRLISLITDNVDGNIAMLEDSYNFIDGISETSFTTNNYTFNQFLEDFGVLNKNKSKKCLPDNLYSIDFYRGYIEGLIESNGDVENCTKEPIISFESLSENLIRQLKEIYLKFGIYSNISERDNVFSLQVDDAEGIKNFADNIVLYRKQVFLNEAAETIKNRIIDKQEKHMRFCGIKSIEYVGKENTYCLKVEGRNFIANNMISSNSIHPMGAAYNASIVKVGTSTSHKGDFYEAIMRNKSEALKKNSIHRNHFEYNADVVSKYNTNYAKYLAKEKKRLGEKSDEYRMSYMLEWIIERGMFINYEQFEKNNLEGALECCFYDKSATHCVGIDVGGKGDDSTVITVVEVDWSMPVIMESRVNDETGEEEMYLAFNTYLKAWCEIQNVPDYEEQYYLILDYLKHFKVARVVVDATRESAIADRLKANTPYDVVPFVFTQKSKSELYKLLDKEIVAGRAKVCAGEETKTTKEFNKFVEQLSDLQKGYSGSNMLVSHPNERGAHDDFPDSWSLAVYGCSYVGEVSNIQTGQNVFTTKTKNEIMINSRINKITAKRR